MPRYYSFLLHSHRNYSTTTSSADAAAATSTQMPPTTAEATDPVESNYAVPQHLKHAGPPARQTPPPPPPPPSTQTSPAAGGGHQQQQQQQHHKQQHHKQQQHQPQQHQPQPTKYDAATRTAVPPPLPPLDLLDFIRQHLLRGKKAFHYRPWQFRRLAELAIASFSKQPTLLEIQGPVNVCGDIHGQYSDLLRIFHACGPPHKTRFLFLGDYVDRGNHSLEVICLLLAYKIQFPEHVFLLRGNHELIHINRIYGFHEEVRLRFSHPPKGGEDNAAATAEEHSAEADALFNLFNQVFAYMPLAATIGGKILCMHGGISPQLRSLDDIRQIQRPIPTVTEAGLVQDLLWSDPHTDIQAPGFPPNPQRCCSVLFGEEALKETLTRLNIQLVMRAHQVVRYGYQEYADGKLVTIFSAPRYNTELQNWAAVAKVSAELKVSFVLLKPTVQDERTVPIKDDGTDTQQSC